MILCFYLSEALVSFSSPINFDELSSIQEFTVNGRTPPKSCTLLLSEARKISYSFISFKLIYHNVYFVYSRYALTKIQSNFIQSMSLSKTQYKDNDHRLFELETTLNLR